MRRIAHVAIVILVAAVGTAQEIDYNQYYRFPLSVEVGYQSLTPFAEFGGGYQVYEISSGVRVPLRAIPQVQPLARVGLTTFDNQDVREPEKWDHTHTSIGAGAGFVHRFEQSLEVGTEALAGYSASRFPSLSPDGATVGQHNLWAEIGGRINLAPLYNFVISINPSIRYSRALGPLADFDGFALGLGLSGSFRFGRDPDAAASLVRSIEFSGVEMPPLFASMHSYYAENPVTTITLTNTERYELTNVEVSFFQAGYMDNPTPSAQIDALEAGESVEVPLSALFNAEIFRLEGSAPLTGEVVVSYTGRGRPAEQRRSVTYTLHDKSAVTWDDARKVAALITPSDSAVRNYASYIRQAGREALVPGYPEEVQFAIQAYYALEELGCAYQVDPVLPFTEVQEDPMVVDSVSLARDTLTRTTGDCDDLTVLYNTILESSGVETGFITTPGHIFSVFNTGIAARDYVIYLPVVLSG